MFWLSQSFVDYLALKLANIPGIEYDKPRDNADCLIIDTALWAAAESLRCVTVVRLKRDFISLMQNSRTSINPKNVFQIMATEKRKLKKRKKPLKYSPRQDDLCSGAIGS